jgi:putative transposase
LCHANYSIGPAPHFGGKLAKRGIEISDARELKGLEKQNRKLGKLLADSILNVSTLKEMLGKNL